MKTLVERLAERRPLLLDGATGTELNRRGVATSLPLWSATALLTARDTLRQIHAEYIAAGAELITANTFRTHARNLAAGGLDSRAQELTCIAVEEAQAAAGSTVYIAGSMAPLEDCYSPHLVPPDRELVTEHRAMAENLTTAGVDCILVETMNTIRESRIATQAAAATGLPVLTSFVCGMDGQLLSGESIRAAAQSLLPCQPQAILINCGSAPSMLAPLKQLASSVESIPLGVYANIGSPDPDHGWRNTDAYLPKTYAQYAAMWLQSGATILGGCCGTTPAHIQQLAKALP